MRYVLAVVATLALTSLLCGPLCAGTVYDTQAKTLRIVDYPEKFACTPANLLQTDQMNDWNIVTYDQATDSYTVAADMIIGDSRGSDTYFQIGSKEHPNETLLVKGNVLISADYTPAPDEKMLPGHPRHVNRLTLGSPDDASIKASLKIFSEPGNEHTLAKGGVSVRDLGGQLFVYNSTITAAIPDAAHSFGAADDRNRRVSLGGKDKVVFKNATLSWFAGLMTYNMDGRAAVIEDSLFENGGRAILANAKCLIQRTTFRNLLAAAYDWGLLDVTFVECTFENNVINWQINTNGRVRCIDCAIGPTRAKDVYYQSKDEKSGTMRRGMAISQRHIIVEVVNAQGQPVQGAAVQIACEQNEPDAVTNGKTVTSAEGKTLGKGQDSGILLMEFKKEAGENITQPATTEYSYTISATAKGCRPGEVKSFQSKESWEVVKVTLQAQ